MQATYEDANLILRLFELRRDETLRQARSWFMSSFKATTMDEMFQVAGPGTKENTYVRMVVSYWDMAASFVTAGVLNQTLFFESNGEMLVVWEKIRGLIDGFRAMTKNPKSWHNIETVGNAYIEHVKASGPEAYDGFQGMLKMMASAAAAASAGR